MENRLNVLQSVIIFDITNCKSIIYIDIFVEFYINKRKFRVRKWSFFTVFINYFITI
jgi:hypothetical protein